MTADPDLAPEPWDFDRGLSGWRWRAQQPRGTVLLLHGWGDHTGRWADPRGVGFVGQLISAGFSVAAFDLRGCGESPGRRGLVDVEEAVEDHLAARRALVASGVDAPVFLMGHSLGGLVTTTSVVRDQTGVAGMVLLAPAILYPVGPLGRLAVRVGARLAPARPLPLPAGTLDDLTSDVELQTRLAADRAMTLTGLSWLTARGGAVVSHANWSRYGEVMVPTLAVHGSADRSTDPRGSKRLIDTIGAADATHVSVDGARHLILEDHRADEVRGTVIDWLMARSSGA